jgi:hypothetical protein
MRFTLARSTGAASVISVPIPRFVITGNHPQRDTSCFFQWFGESLHSRQVASNRAGRALGEVVQGNRIWNFQDPNRLADGRFRVL